MPLRNPITEPQIPQPIARDAEVTAAINAHVAATDPHTQYLLQSEGDARYLAINAKASDAESVDGIDSSRIVFGENWHKAIGASVNIESVFYASGFLDCYGGGGTFPPGIELLNGFQSRHGNPSNLWGMQAGCQHNVTNEFFFRTVTGGVWQPWRRIWNDGNFDPGNHAQVFTPATQGISKSTGGIATIDNSYANQCGLVIEASNASSGAYFSFHQPGIYGVHFGIDANNQLCIGGWSMGNASYRIFHEGSPPIAKAPLPTANSAGNSFAISWNSVQPGQGIAELCNYAGLGGGDAFNFFRMPGNADSAPTISHRVSRIDITGAYIQTSDKRVKSNFSPAPGLEVILALSPQKYRHWECTGLDLDDLDKKSLRKGKNFKNKIGFVAQEVRKVVPEAVQLPESEEELMGIDYACIVACAVRAIQELDAQVQELRSQLAAALVINNS